MDEFQLLQLGSRIKEIRMERNMTQTELAIECDFEKASMSRIEAGQSNLTLRSLDKICKALNIHIIELFKE
jgi:transcriptional regulator with XRE-family HTH domain